jgi:hypothetical protein
MNALRPTTVLFAALTLLLSGAAAYGSHNPGFDLAVVVNGEERPEYNHRGRVYIEALRGRNYSLQVHNPLPTRVAVALAVDGLNTIDARHTDPLAAAKWVIEPYGTLNLSGWQIDQWRARRFFFTDEEHSYGEALGQTGDLGVIEAVFFAERRPRVVPYWGDEERKERAQEGDAGSQRSRAPSAQAAPEALADDYAATGMGDGMNHQVSSVSLDLEPRPVARLSLRYEFRAQLVELGVLSRRRAPLERREQASGFASFCPQPPER